MTRVGVRFFWSGPMVRSRWCTLYASPTGIVAHEGKINYLHIRVRFFFWLLVFFSFFLSLLLPIKRSRTVDL